MPTTKKPAQRLTVRLWDPAERAAWTQLRAQVGAELGRIPTLSELAASLGVLAHENPKVRAELVAHLADTDRKAAAS
jgi:hypothetical protein